MIKKTVSLRERQKASTRQELLHFGMELFFEHGFANTTIEQIVQPLGISKRTFFRYFSSKEELVFAWNQEKTQELVNALNARPDDEPPFEAVCQAISSLLTRYDEAPKKAFALVHLIKETPSLVGRDLEKSMIWEKAFAATLLEREGNGVTSLLQARVIAGTAIAAWTAALDEWYECGGKENLRPIVEKAFALAKEL